jgi:hypothetical protein
MRKERSLIDINNYSKIEVRFVINPTYAETGSTFIYLTDFIDITYNTEYETDLEEFVYIDEPNDYPVKAYLDDKIYLAKVQDDNPIVVTFDPKIIEKGRTNVIYTEFKYTFSDVIMSGNYDNFDSDWFIYSYLWKKTTPSDHYSYTLCEQYVFYSFNNYLYFKANPDKNNQYYHPIGLFPDGKDKFSVKEINVSKRYDYFELTRGLPYN